MLDRFNDWNGVASRESSFIRHMVRLMSGFFMDGVMVESSDFLIPETLGCIGTWDQEP